MSNSDNIDNQEALAGEGVELAKRLRRACDPHNHVWRHERDELGTKAADMLERLSAMTTRPAGVEEVERLRALAKANNQLARMNGLHRDEWRAKAVACMEALEPFAVAWDEAQSWEEFDGADRRETYLANAVGLEDFRRARAALTPQQATEEGV